jgi:hypothetical protein
MVAHRRAGKTNHAWEVLAGFIAANIPFCQLELPV